MKKWVPLIVLSFVLVTFVAGHKANEVVTDYLTELDINIENISKKHDTIVSDLQTNIQNLENQLQQITTLDTKITEVSETIWKPVVSVRTVPLDENTPPEVLRMMPAVGGGTGFFFKQEGDDYYVITNLHVVKGYLLDKEKENPLFKLSVITAIVPWEYDAEVIGVDEITDIAVLKITVKEEEKFDVVEFVEKGTVSVGIPVIAVGHGLNLWWTITTGIVTGVNRIGAMPLNFMLQHDAVINMGNSGGPLFDMEGRVIGVNTLILSPNRSQKQAGWDGVAFAVNAWQTKRSVEAILKDGEVTYPNYDFKVRLATLEEAQGQNIAIDERTYAVLDEVNEDTEGYKAGLRNGDIVKYINEYEVFSPMTFMSAVMAYHIDDVITIKVQRGSRVLEFKYQLLELKL